jgi:hypothetical protein
VTSSGQRSNETEPSYWFPAKRYGWGWGPPATWQGWVVLIGWFVALLVGGLWLAPRSVQGYLLFTLVLTALLLGVCYAKGEPPRWRWGGKER